MCKGIGVIRIVRPIAVGNDPQIPRPVVAKSVGAGRLQFDQHDTLALEALHSVRTIRPVVLPEQGPGFAVHHDQDFAAGFVEVVPAHKPGADGCDVSIQHAAEKGVDLRGQGNTQTSLVRAAVLAIVASPNTAANRRHRVRHWPAYCAWPACAL
jgi:hypothetical protein